MEIFNKLSTIRKSLFFAIVGLLAPGLSYLYLIVPDFEIDYYDSSQVMLFWVGRSLLYLITLFLWYISTVRATSKITYVIIAYIAFFALSDLIYTFPTFEETQLPMAFGIGIIVLPFLIFISIFIKRLVGEGHEEKYRLLLFDVRHRVQQNISNIEGLLDLMEKETDKIRRLEYETILKEQVKELNENTNTIVNEESKK